MMGDKAYKTIKRFFSEHWNRSTFIKKNSSDGKIIVDEEEKLRTWKEYFEKLFGNKQTDTIKLSMTMRENMQYNTGSPIFREEFELALKELKSNKLPRLVIINGELLKV